MGVAAVGDLASPAARAGRRRRGAVLPRRRDAVLRGVPATAQEHVHGDGRRGHRARFLPEHRPRRRRPARHGVAAQQHERVQAGEHLLVARRDGDRQLRVLLVMCQTLQIPKCWQVAPSVHSVLNKCALFFAEVEWRNVGINFMSTHGIF